MRYRILCLGFLMQFVACGTYRTGSGHYSGVGPYKNPSGYSSGVDSSDYTQQESQGPRGRLETQIPYRPRATFKLVWPLEQVHINRGFHPADDPKHEGLDLGGNKGIPIWAANEGVVIYAGSHFSGYGNMVLVEYNEEWATLYAHLDSLRVREGQVVEPGTALGTMGATGHATGVHLHFEVMHNRTPVDPIPLLTRPVKFASSRRGSRTKSQRR